MSTAYNFWRSHSARLTKAALRRYRDRQELLFADTILKLTVIAPRHRRSNGSLASQHAVGAVANLVSASGVMVSLIHLGIQIRQHTGTEQARVFNEIFSNSTAQNLVMFGPTHIDVVISGMQAFNGLSARDKLRFDHWMMGCFNALEATIFSKAAFLLGDDTLENWAFSLRTRSRPYPGVRDWWSEEKPVFAPETRAWIDKQISEIDTENDYLGLKRAPVLPSG